MKLVDLHRQYMSIKKPIDAAIKRIVNSTDFILGKDVEDLERAIAKYCHVPYAVGLNSGTDALLFALRALGIKRGDEVITTPFTFIATAEMIALEGARPVFADIDPATFNIDPAEIEKHITKRTKAIIPVHLYGQPAAMPAIMKIARKHKLPVIEDAAQAIGAKIANRPVCTFGEIGCLSFFPAKNLGCYGDGGMLLTRDKKIADRVRMMLNHGSRIRYHHEFIGDSSRLDNLQAAILNAKLPYLNVWNKKRAAVARLYNSLLKPPVITPYVPKRFTSVFQQYTIRIPNRTAVRKLLEKIGIPSAIHYPIPLHLQPAIKKLKLGYRKGDFPHSEKASGEVLSLPMYPEITKTEIITVARTINQAVHV